LQIESFDFFGLAIGTSPPKDWLIVTTTKYLSDHHENKRIDLPEITSNISEFWNSFFVFAAFVR